MDAPIEGEVRVEARGVGFVRRGFAEGIGWISLILLYAPMFLMWGLRGIEAHMLAENLRPFLGFMTLGSPVLALIGLRMMNRKPPDDGVLVADGEKLVVERKSWAGPSTAVFPRAAILGGVIVPVASGTRLEIEIEGNDVLRAELADREGAERLLSALGLDAAHHRVRMRAGKNTPPVLLATLFTFLAAIATAGWISWLSSYDTRVWPRVGWLAFVTAIGWIAAKRMTASEVTVGTDGVMIRSWRTRLVRYRDLLAVDAKQGRLFLFLRDGRTITLGSQTKIAMRDGRTISLGTRDKFAPAAQNCAALRDRIQAAMRAGEGNADASALKLLERDAQPFEAWRTALRALVERARDYRERALSRDELVRVLEDPTARADHRLGAALTLRSLDPEEAPQRIRVAAESCADEHLRVALEKTADGDLDESTANRATRELESDRS